MSLATALAAPLRVVSLFRAAPARPETAAASPVAADVADGDGWLERRRYPRVQAPVVYRSVPLITLHPLPAVDLRDLGQGGARVYSDVQFRVGQRLEVELFPEGDHPIVAQARIAWVRTLPPEAPAVYDVGLE